MKIPTLNDKSITDMNILSEYKYMLNKDVAFINNECEKLVVEQDTDIKKYEDIISKFPKCAVRSAAQECNCDSNCISSLFNNIKWSENCKLYDLTDIFNIKKYKNCNGASHRPKANLLVEYNFGNNILEAKRMYNLYFEELCNDSMIFDKLKCATYELRDECFNDKVCTRSALSNNTITNCSNPSYLSQLTNIYDILFDIPETSMENHDEIPGQRVFDYYATGNVENLGRSLKQHGDFKQNVALKEEEIVLSKSDLFIICGMWCVAYFLIRNCKNMKFYKKLGIVLLSSLFGYLVNLIMN